MHEKQAICSSHSFIDGGFAHNESFKFDLRRGGHALRKSNWNAARMGRVVLHIPIYSCRSALYGDRFNRNWVVVFEAVFAREGEEGVDDCDSITGLG